MPDLQETLPEKRPARASGFLDAKLAALRRKGVATAALTGAAMAVAAVVELLALAMFIDWCFDLAWGVRLLLLLAQAALAGYILIRYVAAPLIRPPDEDELALMVERSRSVFRSRLIAAVQLTRPGAIPSGASVGLVRALIEETEAIAAPMDFNAVVPTEKLKRLGMVAGLVTLLGTVGFIYGGKVSTDLLQRVFLSNTPVPRKTRVSVVEGNKIIGRGDSVRLEAAVAGVIPSSGKLEIKYPGRRPQEFSLEQDLTNRRRFGRTIENVQETFSYILYLNDGQSPAYTVRTIPRPTLLTMECDQQFPAYTRLKPVHRSLGDLSLLSGSQLNIKATATKALRTAALKFAGAAVNPQEPAPPGIPVMPALQNSSGEMGLLKVSGQNSNELSGSFIVPAKGLAGFSVLLLDTEGMESKDSVVYRVETIPDKPPIIRITYPDRREELITRQATLPIAFEASDDFEIAKLRLRYKVDTVDDSAEKTVELDLEGGNVQRVKRRHEWKIGELSPLLAEGSKIEYWIEAEDNNDATGPGIGSSEHQFIRVVSESDKRADLLNRAGDYLGSISDVAGDQEKLNQKLGAIIRERLSSESK